jgi:hypothetical protein
MTGYKSAPPDGSASGGRSCTGNSTVVRPPPKLLEMPVVVALLLYAVRESALSPSSNDPQTLLRSLSSFLSQPSLSSLLCNAPLNPQQVCVARACDIPSFHSSLNSLTLGEGGEEEGQDRGEGGRGAEGWEAMLDSIWRLGNRSLATELGQGIGTELDAGTDKMTWAT